MPIGHGPRRPRRGPGARRSIQCPRTQRRPGDDGVRIYGGPLIGGCRAGPPPEPTSRSTRSLGQPCPTSGARRAGARGARGGRGLQPITGRPAAGRSAALDAWLDGAARRAQRPRGEHCALDGALLAKCERPSVPSTEFAFGGGLHVSPDVPAVPRRIPRIRGTSWDSVLRAISCRRTRPFRPTLAVERKRKSTSATAAKSARRPREPMEPTARRGRVSRVNHGSNG